MLSVRLWIERNREISSQTLTCCTQTSLQVSTWASSGLHRRPIWAMHLRRRQTRKGSGDSLVHPKSGKMYKECRVWCNC
jgi:hypothetical protein